MDQSYPLTKLQQKIFDRVETSSDNLLICGEPGVGKSVLIRALVEQGNKFYHVAAPTGLAAINIGGRTIHSIFSLPTSQGIVTQDYDHFMTDGKRLANIKYNLKHLIIDEISMVRSDMFDFIDRFLRYAKEKPLLPFGGVQIIAVGDFYQLPPVCVKDDAAKLRLAGWESPFIFSSAIFPTFKVTMLNEVLRQKDAAFIKILGEARSGFVSAKSLAVLNRRVDKNFTDIRIRLTASNKESNLTNTNLLAAINEPEKAYMATEFGEWPVLPCERELVLKVGAQVMVKLNGADRQEGDFKSPTVVVNGTLGKVVALGDNGTVNLELRDGTHCTIYRKRFEYKVKKKGEDGKYKEVLVASFEQIPLTLAWSITMHKSQGQSFDAVHIDASKVFTTGQLYVALSRARTLEGITLEAALKGHQFKTDKNVAEFFENLYEKA